jgi:pimeloyl-ACP methyl ester carboxylesterase
MTVMKPALSIFRFLFLLVLFAAPAALAQNKPAESAPASPPTPPTGKAPIIIIPGITGSELKSSKTDKTVWFTRGRNKDEDIRLPISPDLKANRDSLVPGDIIRGVRLLRFLPEVEIYNQLIVSLEQRGGYREAKWDDPKPGDDQDTFYVFPYDWRIDNVETARRLIRDVEQLKRKLGKPDLKFNIIAHSMGGLVARYAAMYGDAELRSGTIRPTWAGAKHLDKIFMLGTPNEGSVRALDALINGLSIINGINIPFFRDIDRFDVFTTQSIYQLLPHEGSLIAYDEELKPIELDIFDPATWEEYDWVVWKDKKFEKKFSAEEQKNARLYFRAALKRAKDFQAAISRPGRDNIPVSFYLLGADCKETPNAFILRQNNKKDRWITQFQPKSFKRGDGTKITSEEIKTLLLAVGDGVVTKRSLAGESTLKRGGEPVVPIAAEIFQCESHTRLVTNLQIQDRLFGYMWPALTN